MGHRRGSQLAVDDGKIGWDDPTHCAMRIWLAVGSSSLQPGIAQARLFPDKCYEQLRYIECAGLRCGSGHCSENPSALDVAQAPTEQENAKSAKDTKVEAE